MAYRIFSHKAARRRNKAASSRPYGSNALKHNKKRPSIRASSSMLTQRYMETAGGKKTKGAGRLWRCLRLVLPLWDDAEFGRPGTRLQSGFVCPLIGGLSIPINNSPNHLSHPMPNKKLGTNLWSLPSQCVTSRSITVGHSPLKGKRVKIAYSPAAVSPPFSLSSLIRWM